MEKRTLFYWSKLFSGQLEKGHDYAELKKTITINILDFEYLKTNQYHNVYHLREDNTGHILTDVLEIHFIELPKFSHEIHNIEDVLHRWLIFLGNPNEEAREMLDAKDPVIARATKVLHLLSSDPETVRLAELREKAIWDEVSRTNGAVKQEKIDIAIKMLEEGLSVETVVKITGLAVEEVRNLQH